MKERMRLALLFTVAVVAYANSVVNGFAQDDNIYVLENHAVTAHSLRELFLPNYFSHVFRPLTFASFSLNWLVTGAGPFGFHLVNLLLHAGVTLLVYLLLRRLLEARSDGGLLAFVSALLFAVHPIHTEAVAAIVGRAELLAAGLLLAAWIFHLRDRPYLCLTCFFVALLAKESAIALVPLVLLCDYARGQLKPLLRYGSFVGVGVIYLALFWTVQGGRFGTVIPFIDNPLVNLPASLRILNAIRVAWKFLALQVYPAKLSSDYSYAAITLYANWNLVWPALAAVCLIVLWLWALYTRRDVWAIAGAIYFTGFAVTSNLLFPIGTIMGERLAYIPSVGFCLVVALLWTWLLKWQQSVAKAVLIVAVLALATKTILRNRDWRDNFTLCSSALRVVPESAKMHSCVAGEYARRGQPELARTEYQTALKIYQFPEALEPFGLLESSLGHDEEARRLLEAGLSLAQKGSLKYNFAAVNLAAQYVKIGENDKAMTILDQTITDSPDYSRAWANRAALHYKRGELAAARSDASTALRLDAANSQARSVLSLLNASPSFTVPK
jgi:Tfp pilus assembly protein PilF